MLNVDVRVVKARIKLLENHPFFGSLAMRLRPVERNDISTMATDGTWLFYSRQFLDRMSAAFLTFAVAHEVLHCALGHHVRRGSRDRELWNIACDHVVNLLLRKAGFLMPDWVCCDDRFEGLFAEQVYRILQQEKKKQQEQQQQQPQQASSGGDDQPEQSGGQGNQDQDDDLAEWDWEDPSEYDFPEDTDEQDPGQGDGDDGEQQCDSDGQQDTAQGSTSNSEDDAGTSTTSPSTNESNGSGGEGGSADGQPQESSDGGSTPNGIDQPTFGDPGGCGEILDAAPEYDQAAKDDAAKDWQTYTRQATNVARRQGEGKLPGHLEEVIDYLNTPQTDWRSMFREFVTQSQVKDYTWTKPNVRMFAIGYLTPGQMDDGLHKAAYLIDSSGSVNTDWLRKFGTEGQAALDDGAVDEVIVIFADDGIHSINRYSRGEIIDWTVQGRGGTNYIPSFKWLMENEPDIAVAVYFTDLDCESFGPEPSFPVLWAAYGDDPRTVQQYMARVPFGRCIELTD